MHNRRLLLGAIGAVAAVSAALLLIRDMPDLVGGSAGAAIAAAPMLAMPAPVSKVIKETVPVYLDYSARTESLQDVILQAKVSGYLEYQVAPDGADVKAGDLLYKIDPRDYQAALDQTKAQAQRDAAALDYARANRDCGTQLVDKGYLANDTFDQRSSTRRQAEAALAMDRAAVRSAELNLGYTEIRAPLAGRIGRNQVPVGTLVSPGSTVLNTLVQLDPIYVAFNPSETDLVAIEKARADGKVRAEILLPGELQSYHTGELSFLNNVVDQATGTITARATIKKQ
jgi:multidrug efflux system membrane fusion protein